jgi:hypothetical protein
VERRTQLALALIALFALTQALTLYFFGQPFLCACGTVKVWEGDVGSSGNSQQVTDWYTFSHVIHGFIFYFVLWYFFPRMPLLQRLALAVGIEVAWEITENTPWLISQYREQALSAGYSGDSILNSLSDTVAMTLGFLFASRAPVWATIFTAIGFEIFVGYTIRDNLTLNVLNFIHQFDFIRAWQSGK